MMSLWDALRMNMMISYQELVRTFLRYDDDEPGNHIYTDKINSVCRYGRLDNVIKRTHFTIF